MYGVCGDYVQRDRGEVGKIWDSRSAAEKTMPRRSEKHRRLIQVEELGVFADAE